jgi:hypothetical protein
MRDHKRVFGKTCAELDALAKEAVRRAVADLHAKGIPTYHMEGGKIIETAPDGTRRELDAPRRLPMFARERAPAARPSGRRGVQAGPGV